MIVELKTGITMKAIATAINVPYVYTKKSQYPDEFAEALETFGVVKKMENMTLQMQKLF